MTGRYEPNTWVDDNEASGIVGTAVTAARMNALELAVADASVRTRVVDAVATGNVVIAGGKDGPSSALFDDLVGGGRVLLVGQTDPAENGIYDWDSALGIVERAPDDASLDYAHFIYVLSGTYWSDSVWAMRAPRVFLPVAGAPPVVAALPTYPFEGQEVQLEVDKAGLYGGPYLWHCRYSGLNADGTPRAGNPWHVLDGHPLVVSQVSPAIAISAGAGFTFPAGGAAITIPFAGDYMGSFGGQGGSTGAGTYCYLQMYTAAGVALGASAYFYGNGFFGNTHGKNHKLTDLAAGLVVQLRARPQPGNTYTPEAMYLELKPRHLA